MAEAKQPIRLDEWIPQKIEETMAARAEISGIFNKMSEQGTPAFGTYSWLEYVIDEILHIYRALKIENDRYNKLRTQFVETVGLDSDATDLHVANAAKEMREMFAEMRKVRSESGSRLGNETQPA